MSKQKNKRHHLFCILFTLCQNKQHLSRLARRALRWTRSGEDLDPAFIAMSLRKDDRFLCYHQDQRRVRLRSVVFGVAQAARNRTQNKSVKIQQMRAK